MICVRPVYRIVVLVYLGFNLHHQRGFHFPGFLQKLVTLVHADQLVIFVLRLGVKAAELAGDAETLLAVHAASLLPHFWVEPAVVEFDLFLREVDSSVFVRNLVRGRVVLVVAVVAHVETVVFAVYFGGVLAADLAELMSVAYPEVKVVVLDEDQVRREDLALVQQHVVRFERMLVFTAFLIHVYRVEPPRLCDLHDAALRQVTHAESFCLLDGHF